jgi:glycosyltransferase involved in cell wall biosynthesis
MANHIKEISVIIPLYNKAPYILKAITSVLNQTSQEFELIVINDGSTDDGPAKVIQLIQDYNKTTQDTRHTTRGEEMKDPGPKIRLLNQSNSGVSIARNKGVKAAKYDYIAFLDADDWWDPRFLEEMKNLINEFPEAGVYGSKYYNVKNKISKPSLNHEPEGFKGDIDFFKAYTFAWWMPLTSSSVIIPRDVFIEVNGFKPNLKFAEDFDLWIRIALKYKVGYINIPLAYYNQDVDNVNRAVDSQEIYPPDTYTTFNWDYLAVAERDNTDLKKLLDHLRVISLLRYHLSGEYQKETLKELAKVDFSKQSAYYKRLYSYPRILIKLYFRFLKTGSRVKQSLIKIINN